MRERKGCGSTPLSALDPIAGWYGSGRLKPGISGRVAHFDNGNPSASRWC